MCQDDEPNTFVSQGDLDWSAQECGARNHAEETVRHVVAITAEGFQVLDTETDTLRADAWGSRRQAQEACDELNRAAEPAHQGAPR